jgi:hypothetical protein
MNYEAMSPADRIALIDAILVSLSGDYQERYDSGEYSGGLQDDQLLMVGMIWSIQQIMAKLKEVDEGYDD